MTISEKVELLTTPAWSLKQLMGYLDIKSRATGIKLKEKAINQYGGSVPYGHQYVKRDAILEMLGTDYKRELEVLNEIL